MKLFVISIFFVFLAFSLGSQTLHAMDSAPLSGNAGTFYRATAGAGLSLFKSYFGDARPETQAIPRGALVMAHANFDALYDRVPVTVCTGATSKSCFTAWAHNNARYLEKADAPESWPGLLKPVAPQIARPAPKPTPQPTYKVRDDLGDPNDPLEGRFEACTTCKNSIAPATQPAPIRVAAAGRTPSILEASASGYILPLRRATITKVFDEEPRFITTRSGRKIKLKHEGLDFAVPAGTPVVAVAAGTVSGIRNDCPESGPCASSGNMVVIDHIDGTQSAYMHMSPEVIGETCKMPAHGQRVRQGQVIGCSGKSGFVVASNGGDGAHLHFEVRRSGVRIDPTPFFGTLLGRYNLKRGVRLNLRNLAQTHHPGDGHDHGGG